MKTKKHISGSALINHCMDEFKKIPDHRLQNKIEIPLSDALMSAYAIFSLKFPSLLEFENMQLEAPNLAANLKSIYGINRISSDTQMRAILDPVCSNYLRPLYKQIFNKVQRNKVFELFQYLDDQLLVSVDGTGQFSSSHINCPQCLEKLNSETGELRFYHQLLAASIVNPLSKTVIPLCPEAITKQDGQTKNDCELNAAKRLLLNIREDHPKLKITILMDSLFSTGPHIDLMRRLQMNYIITAKPDNNKTLYEFIEKRKVLGDLKETSFEEEIGIKIKKKVTHEFKYMNDIPLNNAHLEISVNFLEYTETISWVDKDGYIKEKKTRFSWITNHKINKNNLIKLMRAGRCRWKIENETFNTLKNKGYNFEHNYGHGKQNLCTNFALLMMLAFLIDQVQETTCPLFKKVMGRLKKKKLIWDRYKVLIDYFIFKNFDDLLDLMSGNNPPLANSS